MARALALARRAEGRTHPNPPVGAVVLRGGRILGGGRTRPAGGPLAEAVALAAVRRRFGERALRGATLATTLEPCCHHGHAHGGREDRTRLSRIMSSVHSPDC